MSKYKEYIGDSVYADYDGYNVVLTTENGRPDDPSNTIALEPNVQGNLHRYIVRLNETLLEETKAAVAEGKS